MITQEIIGRLDHLTFKGNIKETRHGWLRLTPAYSVHLVLRVLRRSDTESAIVLDPFCGTGTTALVCAEQGIHCDTTDINPFLIWLTRMKTRAYTEATLRIFEAEAKEISRSILQIRSSAVWIPRLHQIEKWWGSVTLGMLGRAMVKIRILSDSVPDDVVDLLKVAFCRTMIAHAKVSFGHQSMSFKKNRGVSEFSFVPSIDADVRHTWQFSCSTIAEAARSRITTKPRAILCDAKHLGKKLHPNTYTAVITSPPYPNRMSYIRELRPYMYWLGYLHNGQESGDLDWKAIGGTWGCATSNLSKWIPESDNDALLHRIDHVTGKIGRRSKLLAVYVQKYFCDIADHCEELFQVVKPGGTIYFIVGNSKFYDVLVPTETIYASLFGDVGFRDIKVEVLRKRTSKKELFEFLISARKPTGELPAASSELSLAGRRF